jgi:hypothetical protein
MPRSPWPAGPRREAAILQRLGRAALGARGDGALRRVNCTTACSSLRYRADTTTRSPTLGPACSPYNTPTPSRIPGPRTQPRPHIIASNLEKTRRAPPAPGPQGRPNRAPSSICPTGADEGGPSTGVQSARRTPTWPWRTERSVGTCRLVPVRFSTGADGRPRCDHAAVGGLQAGPGAEELRSWMVRRYRWRSWPAEPRRS